MYRSIFMIWVRISFVILLFIQCKGETKKISEEQAKETQEKLVSVNKTLVKKDRQKILGYIKRHHLEMKESSTGLWYEIVRQGKGKRAEPGFWATINYKVYLLEGTECYSSEGTGPKTFLIGRGGVEAGLEEGILLLNEGAKAIFIMPPHLAWGLPGDGDKIPMRSIIIYEVELIKLSSKE
jgi:FKBP-type peptidyl-prolyl cis-trans isomerase FkpA